MNIEKEDLKKASSLDDFILFGSVTDTVEVFGQKVTMKTLNAGFLRNLAVETSGLDLIAKDRVWKINVLARAIKSLNGNSLVPDNSDDEYKEKMDRTDIVKEATKKISQWEQFVIDEFYKAYMKLEDEQKTFADEIRKKYEKKTPKS